MAAAAGAVAAGRTPGAAGGWPGLAGGGGGGGGVPGGGGGVGGFPGGGGGPGAGGGGRRCWCGRWPGWGRRRRAWRRGAGRRRRRWRGRRRSAAVGNGPEGVRPEDVAVVGDGGTGAHRAPGRVLHVRLVAGRAEPAVEDLLRGRVPHRDVLAPAGGVAARLHPVTGRTGDGRRRIVVRHVAVLGHVARLPVRRCRQGRRDRELSQTEACAVSVHEADRLTREIVPGRTPVGAWVAVADDRRLSAHADAPGRERHQGESGEKSCGDAAGQAHAAESKAWPTTSAAVDLAAICLGKASTLTAPSLSPPPLKVWCLLAIRGAQPSSSAALRTVSSAL